ncbi:MAG TPA: oligosaccharide flippase family protein [Thermoleophilaceae bacterium]|nr:oligosaccharide flippase family protein [Thermoleophilaceae bacterium]
MAIDLLDEQQEQAAEPAGRRAQLMANLSSSDTGRAAGLGAAVIVVNVIALVFTVVFARVLGASDYGSLAALISAFIILMVPGSALQIATARSVSAAVADGDPMAGGGVRRWLTRLSLATVVVALVAIPLRSLLGAAINVDELWAAAAVPVTAMLWMLVSVERGALQGFQRYKALAFSLVGEATARLFFAILLVVGGLDVTGAFLASALSLVAVALVLMVPLRKHLPPAAPDEPARLRDLLAGSWAPVAGLTLLFALQEVHIIVVKHEASGDDAGSYAVAAVAAKAIIWVAIGLGMYLLPEAARRARLGEDARPILARTLGLIAAAAVPMVLIYSTVGEPLLSAVFGDDLTAASGALPWLGLAMALLASAYLSVQYLLALGHAGFIWILGAAALAEVVLLVAVGANLTGVAIALFGLQVVNAAAILTLAFRTVRATEHADEYLPV